MSGVLNLVTVDPKRDIEANQDLAAHQWLRETTSFQCHQIRAIEQGRLTQKPKGRVSRDKLRQVERAIALSLGLSLGRTT
jgi:mRNA-degrading endonuclease toxin of MazEF toxin-antitoxin module